ncbi:MAG: hypothetical protein OEV08_05060 [Nitrospira sp.]|nr:hypothetical protein [Nitrospira sp.]
MMSKYATPMEIIEERLRRGTTSDIDPVLWHHAIKDMDAVLTAMDRRLRMLADKVDDMASSLMLADMQQAKHIANILDRLTALERPKLGE